VRLPFLDLAPEALEVVECPLLGRKDVDDGVPEIEQNPSAVGVTLDASDRMTGGFCALDDRIGDRARLNLGPSGHEHERIREYRAPAYVDGNKIFAFFFERGVPNDVD
jgi:hypothetical protein